MATRDVYSTVHFCMRPRLEMLRTCWQNQESYRTQWAKIREACTVARSVCTEPNAGIWCCVKPRLEQLVDAWVTNNVLWLILPLSPKLDDLKITWRKITEIIAINKEAQNNIPSDPLSIHSVSNHRILSRRLLSYHVVWETPQELSNKLDVILNNV